MGREATNTSSTPLVLHSPMRYYKSFVRRLHTSKAQTHTHTHGPRCFLRYFRQIIKITQTLVSKYRSSGVSGILRSRISRRSGKCEYKLSHVSFLSAQQLNALLFYLMLSSSSKRRLQIEKTPKLISCTNSPSLSLHRPCRSSLLSFTFAVSDNLIICRQTKTNNFEIDLAEFPLKMQLSMNLSASEKHSWYSHYTPGIASLIR